MTCTVCPGDIVVNLTWKHNSLRRPILHWVFLDVERMLRNHLKIKSLYWWRSNGLPVAFLLRKVLSTELQTQSSLDNVDGVCQDESDQSWFSGRYHVICGAQAFSRIISTHLRFEGLVTNNGEGWCNAEDRFTWTWEKVKYINMHSQKRRDVLLITTIWVIIIYKKK